MAKKECDLVIIGSGPGGYVAAVRAGQLGLKTICVEKESNLGGICLNWGCIPTKALLKNAEQMEFLNDSKKFGFNIEKFDVDFPAVIKRSRGIADQMSKGVQYLFKKYKVERVEGRGVLKSNNEVEVKDKDGKVTDTIKAKNIIVATGARAREISAIKVDRKNVITYKQALIQKEIPKKMVVIGAGAIGVEFAYFYNAFGTEITIVEMMDRIVPNEDEEISKELTRNFKKAKMKIMTGAKVKSAEAKGKGVEVVIENKDGKEETLKADIALNAIGVQGNVEDIGLDDVGVEYDKSTIKVDKNMRTNIDGIFAIGDVAGPPWLAHKASHEGIAAVEFIAGETEEGIDYGNIPACTYCQPQIASVGLTEAKAKEEGYDVRIGKFPFQANGKAVGIGEARGFVKVVIDNKYGEILGYHMIGPEVTEMAGEAALARALDATGMSIAKTIHAHPTLNESVMEAAAQAYGESPNI